MISADHAVNGFVQRHVGAPQVRRVIEALHVHVDFDVGRRTTHVHGIEDSEETGTDVGPGSIDQIIEFVDPVAQNVLEGLGTRGASSQSGSLGLDRIQSR